MYNYMYNYCNIGYKFFAYGAVLRAFILYLLDQTYCLFHDAILCGFYSRAATIPEWLLLNSEVVVKSFVNIRALTKSQFYNITKILRYADSKQNFQLLEQPSFSCKAVLTRHL